MAQTDYHFQTLAFNVFHRKFGSKPFVFYPKFMVLGSVLRSPEIKVDYDRVMITGSDLGIKVLQSFGHLLTKISLTFDEEESGSTSRMAEIAKKSSDSLIELELQGCNEEIWHHIQQPFKNVESLSFIFNLCVPNDVKLNKVFPKLRRLELKDLDLQRDQHVFDCYFEHLKNLSITSFTIMKSIESDVRELIKRNPQIKSLSVSFPSMDFLKFVNKYLPKLENIEILSSIENYSDQMKIQFESVKKICIKLNTSIVPKSITFAQLEELELESLHGLNREWFQFIQQNQKIRKIQLKKPMRNKEMLMLAEVAPNLEECSLNCSPNIKEETIDKFMLKSLAMMKIHFITSNSTLKNNLKARFQKEWFVNVKKHSVDLQRIRID